MIHYKPLLKTLSDKKVSFDELNEKVNGGKMLRSALNSGRYLSLEMIDKICSVLGVPVEKVCQHEDGEQPGESRVRISWDKLSNLTAEKRYSMSYLSKECHLDLSYLSQARKRNAMLPEKVVNQLCKTLLCKPEDLKEEGKRQN